MAHYKLDPPSIFGNGRRDLIEDIKYSVFDRFQTGSNILVRSLSGTTDPLTEERITFDNDLFYPASGIIGSRSLHQRPFQQGGYIDAGELVISYPHYAISGIVANTIKQVHLSTPVYSGMYNVIGYEYDSIGDTSLFLDLYLSPKLNE